MSALADVQRALNLIRQITSEERAAVRLEVLRLMASVIADEAGAVARLAASKQKQRPAVRPLSKPKSPNAPKSPQVAPTQPSAKPQSHNQSLKPIKPVKPVKPTKPIAPK